MSRILGDAITLDFTTSDPATGEVSDADATPTYEVFEDDNDTAILSGDAVKRTGKTGDYRVTFTASTANGFAVGSSYNVIVSATVGGVAAKSRIGAFRLDGSVWDEATADHESAGTFGKKVGDVGSIIFEAS